MQLSLENKIAELTSQLKMKAFELERLGITFEETMSNLKQSNILIDQQRRKIEVLTTEYYTLQTEKEKKVTELEAIVADKEEKLATYEALEKDLDMALLTIGQGKIHLLEIQWWL
jgi:progesterone-induced-blocking factor 1